MSQLEIEHPNSSTAINSEISIEIKRRIKATRNKVRKQTLSNLLYCMNCGEECNILSSGEKLCTNPRCLHVDVDGIKDEKEWASLKLII